MTSQAIFGNFAKVFHFTELKNFTIALNMFMVVDSRIWNTVHRFRISLCSINLVKFVFNGFQNLNVFKRYLLDLVSTFKELVQFSISSAFAKIAITNKILVQINQNLC